MSEEDLGTERIDVQPCEIHTVTGANGSLREKPETVDIILSACQRIYQENERRKASSPGCGGGFSTDCQRPNIILRTLNKWWLTPYYPYIRSSM